VRFYIGIEDLAANALIEVLSENSQKRFVTYRELNEYGNAVVRILSEEKNETAVLIMSHEHTYAMFRNYSDIFVEKETEEGLGIALKDEIDVVNLITKFRGYLALDVLLAFMDKRAIAKLNMGVKS